jgi:hypothetical protein
MAEPTISLRIFYPVEGKQPDATLILYSLLNLLLFHAQNSASGPIIDRDHPDPPDFLPCQGKTT